MINFKTDAHETPDGTYLTLHVSGPFSLECASGVTVNVESLTIAGESYSPDLFVKIDVQSMAEKFKGSDKSISDVTKEISKLALYNDCIFIDGVMARLREIGYEGEHFGRAELGMQEELVVVLEPGYDFCDFVSQRGWTYSEGVDAYLCQKIMMSISWKSKIEFSAVDGTQFFIRMVQAINAHADDYQTKNGENVCEMSKILSEVSIPLFQSDSKAALLWLRDDSNWVAISRLVKVVKRIDPDARSALQRDENAKFNWA